MPVTQISSRGIELAYIHCRALFRSYQAKKALILESGSVSKENVVVATRRLYAYQVDETVGARGSYPGAYSASGCWSDSNA
jgi:hypothetical protein